MSEVSTNVQSILGKLEHLNIKMDKLKADNRQLLDENRKLKGSLAEEQNQKDKIQEDHDRLKMAKSLVTTINDRAGMKFKVNELVKEIDRCIALLNR